MIVNVQSVQIKTEERKWKAAHILRHQCFSHGLDIMISKIQLVVYYQCCVLIGWATTRLYVIAHQWRKAPALKPKQWRLNCILLGKVVWSRYFWPTSWIFLKKIIPRARMGSESIAHSAFSFMDYWLRAHSGSRNNCWIALHVCLSGARITK